MTTETKKEIKEIVVVHTTQHVTRRGYLTGYYNYWVAAGQNPRGPLGGRNGNVVDGDFVSDRFYKREKAVAFAKKYAEENDAIFDDEPRKIKSKTK